MHFGYYTTKFLGKNFKYAVNITAKFHLARCISKKVISILINQVFLNRISEIGKIPFSTNYGKLNSAILRKLPDNEVQ